MIHSVIYARRQLQALVRRHDSRVHESLRRTCLGEGKSLSYCHHDSRHSPDHHVGLIQVNLVPASGRDHVHTVGGQQLETISGVSPVTEWVIQSVKAGELAGTRVARQNEHRKITKWVLRPRARLLELS